MENRRKTDTRKLALLSILAALVALLSYLGGFIKLGSFASINLTLVPVVIGAAMCGPIAGALLGGIAGAFFFLSADALFWLNLSVPGTILTVMIKGIVSGYCAGLIYKLIANKNKTAAVFSAAFICPVVNTAIFLIGCLLFFLDAVASMAGGSNVITFVFVGLAGINFILELAVNMVLSPAIVRLLNIKKA